MGTVVLLGPKDLPLIARAAGRLTGKAVGYLQTMRGQVDIILQQSQVDQVQKELRETMAQLDAIRHEIRTGVSIMHPRSLVRNQPSHIDQATDLVGKFESTLDRFVASAEGALDGPIEGVGQTSVELQRQATSYARFARHLNSGGPKPQTVTVPNSMASENVQSDTPSQKEHFPVLPISAVSMGLFPSRTGPLSGGSDLVLESLAERKVAQQALEFLEQPSTT